MQLRRRPCLLDRFLLEVHNTYLVFIAHGHIELFCLRIDHQRFQRGGLHTNTAHDHLLVHRDHGDVGKVSLCGAASIAYIEDARLRSIDTGVGPGVESDILDQVETGCIEELAGCIACVSDEKLVLIFEEDDFARRLHDAASAEQMLSCLEIKDFDGSIDLGSHIQPIVTQVYCEVIEVATRYFRQRCRSDLCQGSHIGSMQGAGRESEESDYCSRES